MRSSRAPTVPPTWLCLGPVVGCDVVGNVFAKEGIQMRPTMLGAHADVPAERSCGAVTEVHRSHLGAFAFDDCHALVRGPADQTRKPQASLTRTPQSSSNLMRASSRRSLNSLLAHAFPSEANSSSLITGTGFIIKVGGDRVLIGFSGRSSSSTSQEQMVQPAVSDFDCAGFVGVTEDCQPFPDGGPDSPRVAFPASASSSEERHRRPYHLRVFGERPLHGDGAANSLQILQVRGHSC
jgi:hypothetical protein